MIWHYSMVICCIIMLLGWLVGLAQLNEGVAIVLIVGGMFGTILSDRNG